MTNVEMPPTLLDMSQEELAFRGWTREGMRARWPGRVGLSGRRRDWTDQGGENG